MSATLYRHGRLAIVAGLAGLAVFGPSMPRSAFGFPFYFSEFQQTYPQFPIPITGECRICHKDPNGGGPRNPFGVDFSRQLDLVSIEEFDSDGDGVANIAEINRGSMPGRVAHERIARALAAIQPIAADYDVNGDASPTTPGLLLQLRDAADVIAARNRETEETTPTLALRLSQPLTRE